MRRKGVEMSRENAEEMATRFFRSMYSITLDTTDARDCAIIMVKELKKEVPKDVDMWDEVINELKGMKKQPRNRG